MRAAYSCRRSLQQKSSREDKKFYCLLAGIAAGIIVSLLLYRSVGFSFDSLITIIIFISIYISININIYISLPVAFVW